MKRMAGIVALGMALLMSVQGVYAETAGLVQGEAQRPPTLTRSPAEAKPGQTQAGEVIVTFKEGVSREEAEAIAEALGMEVAGYYKVLSERNNRPYLLLRSPMTTAEMTDKLQNHEAVEAVSPNYSRQPMSSEMAEPAQNVIQQEDIVIKKASGLDVLTALLLAVVLVVAGVVRLRSR